jgi:hypothetical protein
MNALIILGNDFKRRNLFDWLWAHISGALPPHRYRGTLELKPDSLIFYGLDTYAGTDAEFRIDRRTIRQVYHGYDDIYNLFQTRGIGLSWAPVRLTVEKDFPDSVEYVYIIAGYDQPLTSNAAFYSFLIEWLS